VTVLSLSPLLAAAEPPFSAVDRIFFPRAPMLSLGFPNTPPSNRSARRVHKRHPASVVSRRPDVPPCPHSITLLSGNVRAATFSPWSTRLKILGFHPDALDAVRLEDTPILPGLDLGR